MSAARKPCSASAAAITPINPFQLSLSLISSSCLQVEAAKVPEFTEVVVDPESILGEDPDDVLINVAPKKPNWDLRRDVAEKLSRLERRTQAAMVKLMAEEERRRLEEEGGLRD